MATRKNTPANSEPSKVSTHDLNGIEGWEELESDERDTVRSETIELDKALLAAGKARLAIGEHLFNVCSILKPKRMFNKYLLALNWTSRASAYRYIDLYTAVKEILPEPFVEQANLRGMERFNLKRLEETPPPNTKNVVAINEYLDTIAASAPQEPSTDANVLKKEVFNAFDIRFQRLPPAGRSRSSFVLSLVAMMLGRAGFSDAQSIMPAAVPAGYRGAAVQRPRKAG